MSSLRWKTENSHCLFVLNAVLAQNEVERQIGPFWDVLPLSARKITKCALDQTKPELSLKPEMTQQRLECFGRVLRKQETLE